jgi:hypothetical protein
MKWPGKIYFKIIGISLDNKISIFRHLLQMEEIANKIGSQLEDKDATSQQHHKQNCNIHNQKDN